MAMPETPYASGSAARGPRVVIIGLGVVGAAVVDELAQRGWTQLTVVEQGPLFAAGGSSSHAPGFVFQISPVKAMSELAQRTLDKFDNLDVPSGWISKRVGGLEIATTPARLAELHRRHGFAEAFGVPARILSAGEVAELWPGLDTSRVLGGLHTPTDAVVKGVRAIEFQARRAQAAGARIRERTKVTAIRTQGGKVSGVEVARVGGPPDAAQETIDADIVISCAGFWGPGLARELLGLEIPMLPVEHGFGISRQLASLGHIDEATEVIRPMLRHQDHAMYLREYGGRITIGAYEHRPIPVEHEQIASPERFAETGIQPSVHPFTAADYLPTWKEAGRLLPELQGSELETESCFNGIFSFTPDGGPLLGPVPAIDGLWLAQAVWVTQSGGVGQVIADWLTSGDPGIDTHGLDLSRFDPNVVTRQWSRELGEESYDEVYDIVHPRADTLRMRGLRTSPFYERQIEHGAVFGSANGWERPLWYTANATRGIPLLGDGPLPPRDRWSAQHWSPTAAVEVRALREGAGVVDMSSLPRLWLTGAGATEFLNSVLSRPVGKTVGSVVYALLLDDRGGVLSDITVARVGDERYHLGANGNLDAAWLRLKMAQLGVRLQLTDATAGHCGLGLWGPKARDVLSVLVEDDVSHEAFRFYRCRELSAAGAPVLALRLSYIGELGWELYTPAEFGRHLWDALFSAGQDCGILPVGRRAFESMRLEKGFRLWGTDVSREHTPAEAGLDFAVRGEAAERLSSRLAEHGRTAVRRRLCCLVLDDPAEVLMGHEPVYAPDSPTRSIGYVTSADQGFGTGLSIAYAWLPPQFAAVGQRVDVVYFDQFRAATVSEEPLFDPSSSRMRR